MIAPHRRSRDDECVLVEPATADGLEVRVRLIAIPEAESNPLRARQLGVIVDLLRCATAEAEQERTSGGWPIWSGGIAPRDGSRVMPGHTPQRQPARKASHTNE
jgi:hypothetical protein